ncbi:MAG TPA: DNA-formamidopyrimidine glycosylase family protein, partial [Paenibacillus sp.]|nr:DNA-formamidopyrimidine glycosylase family protein [Paenibacillus sp.]
MPELPEMETYRTMLNERVAGKTVKAVEVTREKTINVPVEAFRARTEGRTLARIDRRAKMLLFRLDGGDTLVLHLMLGGSMFYGTPEEAPDRTAQVILSFEEDDKRLYFHGLRLGYLHIYDAADLEAKLAKFGPEPLDPGFGPTDLEARLRRSRGALKFALTDQAVLAGIGNCYADEMCFAAGIHPLRKVGDVSAAELRTLYAAMHSTLAEAMRYGGYMESPLFVGDELTGGYNDRCKVY